METTDTELRDLLQTLLKKQNKQAIKNKKIMSKVQKLRSKLKEKDSENVSVKERLINIGLNSTSHGLPNILRAKNKYVKIMWTMFFSLASAIAFVLIITSLTTYFDYEVVTKIQRVIVPRMDFPKLDFCIDRIDLKYPLAVSSLNTSDPIERNNLHQQLLQQIETDNLTDLNKYYDDMVISCMFDFKLCNKSHFRPHFDPTLGKGMCLELVGNLSTNKVGKWFKSGLRLELFLGTFETEFPLTSYQITLTVKDLKDNTYMLPAGFESDVSLTKTKTSMRSTPINVCLEDLDSNYAYNSDLYQQTFKKHNKYTEENCMEICKEKCVSMNEPQNICTQVRCSQSDCPQRCTTSSHSGVISLAEYPTDSYLDLLLDTQLLKSKYKNRTVDREILRKNLILVNVFFDEMLYTSDSEVEKYDWLSLVSNLGGITGLFIGTSFLSFGEFIEAIVIIIGSLLKKKVESLGI